MQRVAESDVEVLIVDDSELMRTMLATMLERDGYRVTCTSSAHEALDYLQTATPDLMLLDRLLPDALAEEFLHELQQDARLATMPVVIVSGYSRANQPLELADAAAYLEKPVELATLLDTVRALVNDAAGGS